MKTLYLMNTGIFFIYLQLCRIFFNWGILWNIKLCTSFFSTLGFEIKFGKINFRGYSKKDLYQTQNGTKYKRIETQTQSFDEIWSQKSIQTESVQTSTENSYICDGHTHKEISPYLFYIKPPKFNSEEMEIQLFFNKLEKYKILYSLSEDEILKLIPNLLNTKSLYYFDSLTFEIRNNYLLLRQQMIKHYNSGNFPYSHWADLNNRKQNTQ